MSMGGGILRTVARAVAPTTSSGFCSACTGAQVQARPSSLRPSCRTCNGTALSQQTASSGNQADFDDWELAGDNLSEGASGAGLLFSPPSPLSSLHSPGYTPVDLEGFDNRFWPVWRLPPTLEEASSAAAELESAFYAYDSLSADDSTSTSSELMTEEFKGCVIEAASTSKDADMDEKLHCGEWVEPRVYSSREIQVARSPVQEAFQLLRNDPNIKSTVISLVSDPDVWHVMMKNKKVQELKRILQKPQGTDQSEALMEAPQEQQPSKYEEKHGCLDGVSLLLRSIAGLSRNIVWQVQEDLFKIIMAIFSLVIPSKGKPGQEEDAFEKAMRSSMVLAVLAMTVVLMKRMP